MRGQLIGQDPGWPSAAAISQACTAALRAQAAAATGADNGPCGSGVGTASSSRPIPAQDVSSADVVLLLEMLSAVTVPAADGGHALRRRYLALLLQALRAPDAGPLPRPAADPAVLAARWLGGTATSG